MCVRLSAVWAACYKRLVSRAIASVCWGHAEPNWAWFWTRTHTLRGYSVFLCVKDTTQLSDLKFFPCPAPQYSAPSSYIILLSGAIACVWEDTSYCSWLRAQYTPACSRLGCLSALSLSNDNYPSIAQAALLEMKMDWISVKCAGRCIVAATRNYSVKTTEPLPPSLDETLNLTHLLQCWLQGPRSGLIHFM